MSPAPFDNTPQESVQKFSIELTQLLDKYSDISSDIMYVIFSFHATQCMETIFKAASKRVKERIGDNEPI